MAVTLLGFDGNAFDQRSILSDGGRFVRTVTRIKLTGSYTAGGDTLDFTNGGGTPASPTTVPPAQQANSTGPVRCVICDGPSPAGSVNANGGDYVIIPGTNPTNWLLKIFATAGTQYAAGAYGTDATTDTVSIESWWAR
jgi:hypothetical protein